MNIETLKYLGDKVDKARQLQEKIKLTKAAIHIVNHFLEDSLVIKGEYLIENSRYHDHKSIILGQLLDFDSLKKLKSAVAGVLTEYDENLKKEFEEL